MDAGEDGWEHLGAGLAEGGGAKEADERESGRSFPTDEVFLTVCVLSICRW